MDSIAILGAGSWGSAIAIHLAKNNHPVLLWCHKKSHAQNLAIHRINVKYLPGAPFPPLITVLDDLDYCLKHAATIIIAVPSHAFSEVLNHISCIASPANLAWLTKGIDPQTQNFFSNLIKKKWGHKLPIAMISGPSFAEEVAKGLPTALTIASNDSIYQKSLRDFFHHEPLRIYLSNDLIGVQYCGTVKNILAIACGISSGLGFGANAQAALITRGLKEMMRLGMKLQAKKATFTGLAGIGDLILTCTDNKSRNRRFGLALAQGHSILQAQENIGQVIEGKDNVKQICSLAKIYQVEMPICQQIRLVIEAQISPLEAARHLMNRLPQFE